MQNNAGQNALTKELSDYNGQETATIKHYMVKHPTGEFQVPSFIWITQQEFDWALSKIPDLARKGVLVNVAKKLYQRLKETNPREAAAKIKRFTAHN